MEEPQTQRKEIAERVSAVESDVRHIDERLGQLSRSLDEGISSIRSLVAAQRQPITAFAGWAAVILTLVFAFGAPLLDKDARLQKRLDGVDNRAVDDAYVRGQYDEKLRTLRQDMERVQNQIAHEIWKTD